MRLGYDLTIEQTQKLVMTPELIQAIQILQFNTQELDNFVQEQLLTNPVLELDGNSGNGEEGYQQESYGGAEGGESPKEDYKTQEFKSEDYLPGTRLTKEEWAEHIKEREYDDISYRQGDYYRGEGRDYSFEQFVTSDITLNEHLMFQLQFTELNQREKNIGRYIIESLDDNGYMTQTREEIAVNTRSKLEDVEKVLTAIHGFEPAGVAAEDLRECLIIQLENLGVLGENEEKIIRDHIEDIAANRLSNIARDMGISVHEVQRICDLIKTLEPKPGRQFASQGSTRYVVPDVLVEKIDGEYVVSINESSSPRLMVSSYYEKVLAEAGNDQALTKFLSGRMNSAIWLIKSIEQRKQTIFNVVSAVVRYHRDFFDKGLKYMKPLTLKQIAEEVGIHESTVSRSVNGKYLQSPRGIYEIKYFFTSGVAGGSGEGVSSESVKTFIREIVAGEDPKKPYSDQDIVGFLGEKDIDISRRTVAKYRDELGILSSSKRKRY